MLNCSEDWIYVRCFHLASRVLIHLSLCKSIVGTHFRIGEAVLCWGKCKASDRAAGHCEGLPGPKAVIFEEKIQMWKERKCSKSSKIPRSQWMSLVRCFFYLFSIYLFLFLISMFSTCIYLYLSIYYFCFFLVFVACRVSASSFGRNCGAASAKGPLARNSSPLGVFPRHGFPSKLCRMHRTPKHQGVHSAPVGAADGGVAIPPH